MLAGSEVSTMLIVFVLLVAAADVVGRLFRKGLPVDQDHTAKPAIVGIPTLLTLLGVLALTIAELVSLANRLAQFVSPNRQHLEIFQEFAPLNTASPLAAAEVLYASLETLAMSALGPALQRLAALSSPLPPAAASASRQCMPAACC
jgi:ABC-type phosphate/phosphonate transport system permease subunit